MNWYFVETLSIQMRLSMSLTEPIYAGSSWFVALATNVHVTLNTNG
jgi:hypothetical protein